ncbi:MAG: type II restriction endonuclease [Dehalococcoidia bacterium]
MQRPLLSNYFKGVATKRLSAVEVQPDASHQHEFNGVQSLKKLFGSEQRRFTARFIYLGEGDDDTYTDIAYLTWYDARVQHPIRSEYRCYYPPNTVMERAKEGDLLVIGLQSDEEVTVMIARAGYTFERQLKWLFKLPDRQTEQTFSAKRIDKKEDIQLDYSGRLVLDQIGIEVISVDDRYLEQMLRRFHGVFPPTIEFSAFARETLSSAVDITDPDKMLMDWMDQEEILFRTLERHLVGERLKKSFKNDVDGFITYSLSVQNRRKSRAGYALENHFEQLLLSRNIQYSRDAVTENKAKPDFIFPGVIQYHSSIFPASHLTMLGVKSTCKDRWRQVLAEAARIEEKHLLTLEPSISENQTIEMRSNKLNLVVPESVHNSYKARQLKYIINVRTFLELVEMKQRQSIN